MRGREREKERRKKHDETLTTSVYHRAASDVGLWSASIRATRRVASRRFASHVPRQLPLINLFFHVSGCCRERARISSDACPFLSFVYLAYLTILA